MKYTVALNEQLDSEGRHLAWLRGYRPGDKMVEGYKGIIPDTRTTQFTDEYLCSAADFLYKIFNIEHPADYHHRSLSVGDVIIFEVSETEKASYAVEPFGFKRLE